MENKSLEARMANYQISDKVENYDNVLRRSDQGEAGEALDEGCY